MVVGVGSGAAAAGGLGRQPLGQAVGLTMMSD